MILLFVLKYSIMIIVAAVKQLQGKATLTTEYLALQTASKVDAVEERVKELKDKLKGIAKKQEMLVLLNELKNHLNP